MTRERPEIARKIVLQGRVQGVGMRPALLRAARGFQLRGFVRNGLDGVEMVIQGSVPNVQKFLDGFPEFLPGSACVSQMQVTETSPQKWSQFTIEASSAPGLPLTHIPLDRATCADCLQDYKTPGNPRQQYALLSCTACGPRYSIMRALPFEREWTTLQEFPCCPSCQQAYSDPADRRFHAQTIGCAECGPGIWLNSVVGQNLLPLTDSQSENIKSTRVGMTNDRIPYQEQASESVLEQAAEILQRGGILALRGMGGYQLLADATCDWAVARLRQRKQRPHKPLAVMVGTLEEAQQLTLLTPTGIEWLTSPENPIVLLPTRMFDEDRESPLLSREVTFYSRILGVMLPTTPVHAELCRLCRVPLIVTSGNKEGAPIVTGIEQAERELQGIADGFLHHNREILHPIDDSVIRVSGSSSAVIRAARGLAPVPLAIPATMALLAVGGQQKNSLAATNGELAVLAPHGGDLDSLSQCRQFEQRGNELCQLLKIQPRYLVHDLHPEYHSTAWCQAQPQPCIAVQHHHAHVVSGMLDMQPAPEAVLGVAFDGTGWGTDGTLWGGEFLHCTALEFARRGHFAPFRLPGGEAAIREPWRIGVALLREVFGPIQAKRLALQLWPHRPAERILHMLETDSSYAPLTSSVGRLLDGAGAILLGRDTAAYEGELPLLLESCALGAAQDASPLAFDCRFREDGMLVIDWREAIRTLTRACLQGSSQESLAFRLHQGLADAVWKGATTLSELPVVLAGGCFQNGLLCELIARSPWPEGQQPHLSRRIPVNDGGLAAGQLASASARLAQ